MQKYAKIAKLGPEGPRLASSLGYPFDEYRIVEISLDAFTALGKSIQIEFLGLGWD